MNIMEFLQSDVHAKISHKLFPSKNPKDVSLNDILQEIEKMKRLCVDVMGMVETDDGLVLEDV